MMHAMPCDQVREGLAACLDGELSLDEQVRIQGHLQECVSCRLEASDLAELGHALRGLSVSIAAHTPLDNGRLTRAVVERVRVERQLAFGTRAKTLLQDMHLVWAGLGATVSSLICVFASACVLQAANQERPDSLAGIITYFANPGSNANPVRLDGDMLAPRAYLDPAMPIPSEDAEVALSAVVTREGTIQNVEVLTAERDWAPHVKAEVVLALLDAASRARFEPAQAGGSPVAVSMVWVLSTTTVKGQPDYDLYLVNPPRWLMSPEGPSLPGKPRSGVGAPKAAPAVGNSTVG